MAVIHRNTQPSHWKIKIRLYFKSNFMIEKHKVSQQTLNVLIEIYLIKQQQNVNTYKAKKMNNK